MMPEHPSQRHRNLPPNLLVDTWWFGLTARCPDKTFSGLARLRKKQGFNAIQLIMGIPPEVGPLHPAAASIFGPAWGLKGEPNKGYLDQARSRVEELAKLGLKPIIYGAWGHQIDWIGVRGISSWWDEVIKSTEEFDPIYCLTGESDLWVGAKDLIYPDRSTDDLAGAKGSWRQKILNKIKGPAKNIMMLTQGYQLIKRRRQWSEVLEYLHHQTRQPIILHPIPGMTSEEAVYNPQYLDALTVQTGHDSNTRNDIWQLPLEAYNSRSLKPFLNLEPWYEGIKDSFLKEDQIFAFWASRLAGAAGFCYGAQGIWNFGDGKFLSHWGKQNLSEAMELKTPQLLGGSNKLLTDYLGSSKTKKHTIVNQEAGDLVMVGLVDGVGKGVFFYPQMKNVTGFEAGEMFDPLLGKRVSKPPQKGPLIVLN